MPKFMGILGNLQHSRKICVSEANFLKFDLCPVADLFWIYQLFWFLAYLIIESWYFIIQLLDHVVSFNQLLFYCK